MSVFCRQHAFYDCPICAGEPLVWVIPIVDGANPDGSGGNVVGVIEIPEETREDWWDVPWEGEGEELPPMPIRVTDDMLAEARRLFADWKDSPEMQAAAARGREIHEDALALLDEDPTYDYQEAIEEMLRRREEAEGA